MLPTIISFTLSVWSHLYVSSILAYNSTEQFSFYFPPYIYITYSILNCFTFNVDLWLQAFSSLLTFLVSGTGRSLLDLWAVVVVGKVLNLFPPFSSFLTCHDLVFFLFFSHWAAFKHTTAAYMPLCCVVMGVGPPRRVLASEPYALLRSS